MPQSDPTNIQHPAKSYVDLSRIHHDIYKVSTLFLTYVKKWKINDVIYILQLKALKLAQIHHSETPAIDDLLSATLGKHRSATHAVGIIGCAHTSAPSVPPGDERSLIHRVPKIFCGGFFEEVFLWRVGNKFSL